MSDDNVKVQVSTRTRLLIFGAIAVGAMAVALGLTLYAGSASQSDESAALAYVVSDTGKPASAITKVSQSEFDAACALKNTSAPHDGKGYCFYTGESYVIVYKEDGEWTGRGLERGPRVSP
jgi:hypothetical protein